MMKFSEWIVQILITIIGVLIIGIVGFYVADKESVDGSQWKFLTNNKDMIKDLDKRIVELETIHKYKFDAVKKKGET
ncbi:hypothetical protein CL629_03435 [bacterium]|nr:hypothetical protein [bacterium]|tara:strand:- start:17113 stop:17343 length:231 start_codon:yes stop_codon:yes gene_type:complete